MLVLLGAASTSVGARRSPRQDQTTPGQKVEVKAEYAGAETCGVCHETIHAQNLAYHKQLETDRSLGGSGRSGEACHGPGEAQIYR